jgi:hypothetical protein
MKHRNFSKRQTIYNFLYKLYEDKLHKFSIVKIYKGEVWTRVEQYGSFCDPFLLDEVKKMSEVLPLETHTCLSLP